MRFSKLLWSGGLFMSEFRIFSDGACDIPLDDINKLDITTIPFYVSLDGENYNKELTELSLDKFYDALINNKVFPKTSLPSVSDYTDAFENVLSKGMDVLCFTITDTLSGSYQSALSEPSPEPEGMMPACPRPAVLPSVPRSRCRPSPLPSRRFYHPDPGHA